MTFRYRSHCEARAPEYLRDPLMVASWHTQDPLSKFEAYLMGCGVLDQDGKESTAAAVQAEIAAAIHYAEESPFPPAAELSDGAYAPEDPALVGGRRI
jgi:TPP-dependent pyruvate/acetoin dehydrogenase alpha subunit